MSNGRKFPQAEFDRVHELVNLAKERIEEGPANYEWLLDFNLPDLHRAIGTLYAALGETERLKPPPRRTPAQEAAPGGVAGA